MSNNKEQLAEWYFGGLLAENEEKWYLAFRTETIEPEVFWFYKNSLTVEGRIGSTKVRIYIYSEADNHLDKLDARTWKYFHITFYSKNRHEIIAIFPHKDEESEDEGILDIELDEFDEKEE